MLRTLDLMAKLVRGFRKNPVIREIATSLVQHLPAKAFYSEVEELFEFVQSSIRYVQDINSVETLHTPLAVLTVRHGDCDDMSTLLSALAQSIGFQTRFVAIGFEPDCFEHVYTEIMLPDTGEWIAADPTEPYELGWAAPGIVCRIELTV